MGSRTSNHTLEQYNEELLHLQIEAKITMLHAKAIANEAVEFESRLTHEIVEGEEIIRLDGKELKVTGIRQTGSHKIKLEKGKPNEQALQTKSK